MKTPRISLLMSVVVTAAISVAAIKTYLPSLRLLPAPLASTATALCEKTPTCKIADVRYLGRPDRSGMVQQVMFAFHEPPGKVVVDRFRAEVSQAAGSSAAIKVDFYVNGVALSESAGSSAPRMPRQASGAKQ